MPSTLAPSFIFISTSLAPNKVDVLCAQLFAIAKFLFSNNRKSSASSGNHTILTEFCVVYFCTFSLLNHSITNTVSGNMRTAKPML